mgnify:CR=1 FL=1
MSEPNNESSKDLGSLLQSVFQQKNWQDRIELHQLFVFWDKLVGEELANRAQPRLIRDNILWIGVVDSVWMQQLQFEKQTLLEQINAELHRHSQKINRNKNTKTGPQIKDIKFKLEPDLVKTVPHSSKPKFENNSLPIDSARYKAFEATINSIKKEGIKDSLKKIWLLHERKKNIHKV